jgi:hypothetical protein
MKWSRYKRYECVKQNSLLTFSRNSMATTAYLRVFYRHPGSAILLQKQVSKASIAKIVGVSLPPFTLPLYQDKAATPTLLKDIFTPI